MGVPHACFLMVVVVGSIVSFWFLFSFDVVLWTGLRAAACMQGKDSTSRAISLVFLEGF